MSSYLEDLTLRLARGMGYLPEEVRTRQAAFLGRQQRPDGGFAGREGDSDLYYTGFALRGLALCGALDEKVAPPAAAFLRRRLTEQAPIVDFLSLVYGAMLLRWAGEDVFAGAAEDWPDRVAAVLESYRRPDGGYAKGPQGAASSMYHSFLVALCLQLIDRPLPDAQRLYQFVLDRQRDDGGFVEIAPMRRSGTNPTAAAVGLLKILGRLDEPLRDDVGEFLADMQTDEGGLRANTRIPIADLLSTFTGVLTLLDLDRLGAIDSGAALRYVQSLQQPDGGFLGAAWDQRADVEYTFYGLGSWSLLAAELNRTT